MSLDKYFQPTKKRKATDNSHDSDSDSEKNVSKFPKTEITSEQKQRIKENLKKAQEKLKKKREKNPKSEEVTEITEDETSNNKKTKDKDKAADEEAEMKLTQEDEKNKKKESVFNNLEDLLDPSWREALSGEFTKPYWKKLKSFLVEEEKKSTIYPPAEKIFNALNNCSFESVRVVIIGQDPYHGEGQAEGLCFSVAKGIAIPSSLQNIYKELMSDIDGFTKPKHGSLVKWAKQGILLLNVVLTVKAKNANSHKGKGWEQFTDAVIDTLNRKKKGLIFLCWGAHAKNKAKKISDSKHTVLHAAHPSGLSATKGFFGCKHFSQTNEILEKQGSSPIDWQP